VPHLVRVQDVTIVGIGTTSPAASAAASLDQGKVIAA